MALLSTPIKTGTKAVRSLLDMDTPSRMARAKEQGFDTDKKVYHGTADDFDAFDPDRAIGTQFWSTTNKAEIESGDVGAQGSGVIKEMYHRIKNPAGWDEYDKFGVDELISKGYDGLKLPDGKGDYTYVAFDPSQYRSVDAAFDPAKISSSNLLASNPVATAAAGAGGLLAMTGSDDSYAGGGGLLKNIMPAPQRMFDPANKDYKPFLSDFEQQAGGRYLEMGGPDGPVDVTGTYPATANISVSPDGKPTFQVAGEERTGLPPNEGRKIKTNLFKKKAGWKWSEVPEGFDPNPAGNFPLVSVEDGKNHYYTVDAQFPDGAELARYPNSASEPRLRPTRKGKVELGNKIGEIDVRGKKHPVYDKAVIKEGAAGATALAALSSQDADAGTGGLLDVINNASDSMQSGPANIMDMIESEQYYENQYGTQLGVNPKQGLQSGPQLQNQDPNRWIPLKDRGAEFAEPYISSLLDGDNGTSQAARNRRQNAVRGLLEWSPTEVVDMSKEGYDASLRGDSFEGGLLKTLATLELMTMGAAKPISKFVKGLL